MSTTFVIKPTTKLIRASYLLAILLAIAIVVLGRGYQLSLETQYALLALPALVLIATAWRHFSRRFVRLTVSEGRLRFQSGILNRTTRTLELSRIQDVRCDQRFGQRLLGIGDITIETAGETGRLVVQDIDSPQKVAEHILDIARPTSLPAS